MTVTSCKPHCRAYREEDRPSMEQAWTKAELLFELRTARQTAWLYAQQLGRVPKIVRWFFGAL